MRKSGNYLSRCAGSGPEIWEAGSLVPADPTAAGRMIPPPELGLHEAGPARVCSSCEQCSEAMVTLLTAIGPALVKTEAMRTCRLLAAWLDRADGSHSNFAAGEHVH